MRQRAVAIAGIRSLSMYLVYDGKGLPPLKGPVYSRFESIVGGRGRQA